MPISVKNLYFDYGDKTILNNFSIELPEKGVVCFFGPSGCGKTTLLRLIAGIEKPKSGMVNGPNAGETAFVFQEDRLLPWLSAKDNIAAALPKNRAGEALSWLERVELSAEADSFPDKLSGGMQRRLALARALAFSGKLLILDEAFKGMDEELKLRLFPIIEERSKEIPVLFVTHEEADGHRLANVIYRLDGPPLRIIEHNFI